MKNVGMYLQPMSYWLVAWLVSRWGSAVVLLGTLALAASTGGYLTRTGDSRAQVGRSAPHAVPAVPAQSLCTTLIVGGALACTGKLPAVPVHCTSYLEALVPDSACNDR
jgi:hypothetical protein